MKLLLFPAVAVVAALTFSGCEKKSSGLQPINGKSAIGITTDSLAGIAVNYPAVEDAYVRNGTYASTNYGTATGLVVKSDATSYNRKSYVKFDISAVTGSSVNSATLKLYVSSVNTSPSRTINVYTTTTSWTEGGINWNNAPMDTTLVGKLTVSGVGWYSMDVTSQVNSKLSGTDRKVSFLLANNGAFDPTGDMTFSSREAGSTYAPGLSIIQSASDSTDVQKILANYNLIWNDEFNGTSMDTSKWSYRANGSVRNYATVDGARTVALDGNGHMVIRVTQEGSTYYVGQVSTDGRFNSQYGYYECRAKMNQYIGPHVAFWLQSPTMGNTPYNNPAVNGAEVDIFEYHRLTPKQIWQTIHINGYGTAHQSQGVQVPVSSIDTGYHTFGLLWTDSTYKFYIDGYKTWETTFGLSKRTEYIILSTELTGFGGTPSLGSYPDSVMYDYVRVYQPK
ncbi:DNRLRE domain-containing protein [Chitinophaga sp. Hz27]|uniref:CBM96 family carbohydrate-binding protein n=1 Tax=Chitinophaga sp. Hz27 TaxID=3347169 RepID=UPI0035D6619A